MHTDTLFVIHIIRGRFAVIRGDLREIRIVNLCSIMVVCRYDREEREKALLHHG